MKKTILVFLMLLLFTVFASGSKESWASVGGEIGHTTETQTIEGTEVNATLNSVGVHLTALQFNEGRDQGMIIHDSFHIPLGGQLTIGGASADYSFSEADFKSYLGVMLGPAFRKSLGEGKDFYFGAGPSVQQIVVVYSEYSSSLSYLFGIGVDTGFKIDIGKNTYWDIGLMADASFYSYSESSANPDGQSGSIFNLSLRPHIGIGYVIKMKYE